MKGASIGPALAAERRRLGVSQRKLAAEMTSPQSYLSALENGRYLPNWYTLVRYLACLNRRAGCASVDVGTVSAALAHDVVRAMEVER